MSAEIFSGKPIRIKSGKQLRDIVSEIISVLKLDCSVDNIISNLTGDSFCVSYIIVKKDVTGHKVYFLDTENKEISDQNKFYAYIWDCESTEGSRFNYIYIKSSNLGLN